MLHAWTHPFWNVPQRTLCLVFMTWSDSRGHGFKKNKKTLYISERKLNSLKDYVLDD